MVEQSAVNRSVVGSSPTFGAIFPQQIEPIADSDTVPTQETPELEGKGLKFPRSIKHRGKELARIYGKSKSYPLFRVAWSINGKRRMKAFNRFGGKGGAKEYAEALVKDLAKGSQSTALSPGQATDALAALERLASFFQATGKRISLLTAASEYVEAASKLNGHSMREAVDGYLGTVVSVKRKELKEAVGEFITSEEPRTRAKEGQRAQLSADYSRIRAILLNRFASMFPGHAVCDLTKDHLETFFRSKQVAEFSAKYRNHHRAAIKQLLQWCVRRDYLSSSHRLHEADSMRPEHANTADVAFYTPAELRKLLETAEGPLQAIIALSAFAGLRTAEVLRLDWSDLWRVPGHIEITSGKSKTRQRRLVEMGPALSAWLEPFRVHKSGKLWSLYSNTFQIHFPKICEQAEVKRKGNGLRHAFCSYHFALHSNENLTAAQAGNSPTMIHAHYKGLATKAEAEKWFGTAPVTAPNIIPIQTAANH